MPALVELGVGVMILGVAALILGIGLKLIKENSSVDPKDSDSKNP